MDSVPGQRTDIFDAMGTKKYLIPYSEYSLSLFIISLDANNVLLTLHSSHFRGWGSEIVSKFELNGGYMLGVGVKGRRAPPSK